MCIRDRALELRSITLSNTPMAYGRRISLCYAYTAGRTSPPNRFRSLKAFQNELPCILEPKNYTKWASKSIKKHYCSIFSKNMRPCRRPPRMMYRAGLCDVCGVVMQRKIVVVWGFLHFPIVLVDFNKQKQKKIQSSLYCSIPVNRF